jgi:hypothetical protein
MHFHGVVDHSAMQTRLANAVIRLHYTDSTEEQLDYDLVPPLNYWTLATQGVDYDYVRDIASAYRPCHHRRFNLARRT